MAKDTRSMILQSAADLLDEGGVEAVTLREVGRRAGVSHNAPYRHFNDKLDLLAAVSAREFAMLAAAQADLSKNGRAVTRLRDAIQGFAAWALDYPHRYHLAFMAWGPEHEALKRAAEASLAGLQTLVMIAQSEGDLPDGDPARLASLLLATARGAVDLALAGHLSANGKGRADPRDLIDDLLAALSAKAG